MQSFCNHMISARWRTAFDHRLALVADSATEARAALAEFADHGAAAGVYSVQAETVEPSVAFLFTGQGSQYLHMGRELYQHEVAFRAANFRGIFVFLLLLRFL